MDGLPLTLRAGEATAVRIRFHPSALGMRSDRLQLGTPASPTRQEVDVRGNSVRGLAQLSVQSLDFGDVVLGKTVSLSFTMTNNDGHARTDVRIDPPTGADAAAFHLSQQGTITLASEQSISVQVDFTPGRLGPAQATLQVTPCPTCSALPFVLSGNGVVSLLDMEPDRLALAEKFGATPINVKERNPQSAVFELTGGRGADVVIEAVGNEGAYETALACVRPGGTVSVVGMFVSEQIEIPLGVYWTRMLKLVFAGICPIHAWWERAMRGARPRMPPRVSARASPSVRCRERRSPRCRAIPRSAARRRVISFAKSTRSAA